MRSISGILVTLIVPIALVSSIRLAGSPDPRAVAITLPASNLPSGSAVVSDSLLVYDLPSPLMHESNAIRPFTAFHERLFAVRLDTSSARLRVSRPRLLFTGPRGATISPWSISGGWLIYSQYPSVDPTGPWTLAARNVATGQVVVLDTPGRERLPSLAAQAASDGRTVVWQSWMLSHGQATSVIRAYDLDTGQRRLLAEGGSPTTWSYAWPGVSGRWVAFEKEVPYGRPPRSQVLLTDLLHTGQTRTLTPATAANSEPSIAGDIVAWKEGWRYGDGRGVGVYNVRTGAQQVLAGSNDEQPKVAAGRYVVFPTGTPGSPLHIQLYDVQTGLSRTLAGPRPDGFQPGSIVQAGGHAVLYYLSQFSTSTAPPSSRLVVTLLS